MEFATENLRWTREPESFLIAPDKIEIVTKPRTDLWQRTYYHFQNDNAPVLQMEVAESFFSFVVKTDFTESQACGVPGVRDTLGLGSQTCCGEFYISARPSRPGSAAP